jgi:HEAT repeat protein
MWNDPKLQMPQQPEFLSSKSLPVWLQALAGPEVDLKRQAADTIAIARERGMQGLEAAVEPLMGVLRAEDRHPLAALAAARALSAIDARQAAELLWERAASDGSDVAQAVEPALARWDYPPARSAWLERISAPDVPRRELILAIRGLGSVGEAKARPRLLELAMREPVSADIRLEAGRALGQIASDGLLTQAEELFADKSPAAIVDRLVGASMISGHRGEAAVALLLELAVDSEPSVAAIGLSSLLAIDPGLIFPLAPETTRSADANVRRITAEALVARPTVPAVRLLGPMLDDRDPAVRKYVRQSMEALAAKPELGDTVIEEAMKVLATEQWRGLEQASLLLVALDHKPAADRLVELLEFERPEVLVTAGWGLGRMSVPHTVDAMFEKARREAEKALAGERIPDAIAEQICHLFQALDPILRRYVPKSAPFRNLHRAGAIWALGHLHAGDPEADLAKQLCQRLDDTNSMVPEDEDVRYMSAITVGRMKSEEAVPSLRKHYSPPWISSSVEYACGWALQQITGEPAAVPGPLEPKDTDGRWFLRPID